MKRTANGNVVYYIAIISEALSVMQKHLLAGR